MFYLLTFLALLVTTLGAQDTSTDINTAPKVLSVGMARRSEIDDPDNELRTMVIDPDYSTLVEPLNFDDWCYSFDFIADRVQQYPSQIQYFIGEAYYPHRMVVSNSLDEVTNDDWTLRASFWASPKQNNWNNLSAIYVSFSTAPKNDHSFLSLTPPHLNEWPQQSVFFVEAYRVPEVSDNITCPAELPQPSCLKLVSSSQIAVSEDGQATLVAQNSGMFNLYYPSQKVFLASDDMGNYSPFFDEVGTLIVSSPNNNVVGANLMSKEPGTPGLDQVTKCGNQHYPFLRLPNYESDLPVPAVDITPMFNNECGNFIVSLSVTGAYGMVSTTDAFVCTYEGRL